MSVINSSVVSILRGMSRLAPSESFIIRFEKITWRVLPGVVVLRSQILGRSVVELYWASKQSKTNQRSLST